MIATPTRRVFTQRLIGGLCDRGGSLLSRLPGPPMLSAGIIARDGSGAAALRASDGLALQPGGAWNAFDRDQPFRVASVSKMISTVAFMRLVVSGAVSLETDISSYLGARLRHPDFPDTPITPRMLLCHTSGLRNGADFPVAFNRPLLARLDAATHEQDFGGWFGPASEPSGVHFRYSDTNFALVAQIAERVTGARFDRYMHEQLFAPLGLDIGYNWSGVTQRKRNRAAAGCRMIDGAWTAQVDADPPRAPEIALYRGEENARAAEADYRIGENGFAFAPHGGLRLSLRDMDRLTRFLARGEEELLLMAAPVWTFAPEAANGDTEGGFYQAYGLGMQTPLGREGADAFFGPTTADWRGHCGDAYGWMTGLWWNTRTRASIVYAVNGMPETQRPPGMRAPALTAPEEALIDMALAALA